MKPFKSKAPNSLPTLGGLMDSKVISHKEKLVYFVSGAFACMNFTMDFNPDTQTSNRADSLEEILISGINFITSTKIGNLVELERWLPVSDESRTAIYLTMSVNEMANTILKASYELIADMSLKIEAFGGSKC